MKKSKKNMDKEVSVQSAEAQAEPGLSYKKRRAMVSFMALMLLAAFTLVLLSMLNENHKLRSSNNDLRINSTSALANAQALQDENRNLLQQIDTLTVENQSLQDQLTQAAAAVEAGNAAEEQLAAVQAEKAALDQALNQTTRAYELLIQAQTTLAEKDEEGFGEAMAALEEIHTSLSSQGSALYAQLLEALNEE